MIIHHNENLKQHSYWGAYSIILTAFCSPILYKLEIAVVQSSCHFKFCNKNVIKADKFPYKKTELSARLLTMIPTLQKARKYATFQHLIIFSRQQTDRLRGSLFPLCLRTLCSPIVDICRMGATRCLLRHFFPSKQGSHLNMICARE